jgi:peptide/nickel transport system permease protein
VPLASHLLRSAASGALLLAGVTFLSFLLMVHFAPDQTYARLGKNPTAEQVRELREQLGYDRPFLARYGEYLRELATLDFGHSWSSGERVDRLLARTVPVSLALLVPGFLLGNLLGLALAMVAAQHRGRWPDRLIMACSVAGMSVSFVIALIAFQVVFSSSYGLDLFPVRGWDVRDFGSYLRHVTVPTLATVFVTLGYNTRFYRAVLVEELGRDHVRTARAFGAPVPEILAKHVLPNAAVSIITRVVFSIPLVVIGGSLLIESYFGIPGVGKATYEAIGANDLPVLKAVVGLTPVLFVLALLLTDLLCHAVDPRVELR